MKNNADNQAITEESEKEEVYKKIRLAKRFIRVGDEYMKEVSMPDKDGNLYRTYVKRDKGNIQDDIGKGFMSKYIQKYEGFCLVPSHTNYQKEIHGFFNEYYQISHQPKEGNFNTIYHFLTHVFGNKIDFILDYLQILYLKPTQRLPIILLESKQRGTGKSTFGSLLKLIFEDNTAKLGNTELESDFNAIWVKRLAIIVDETSLEKNSIMQMLKRFSTETGKVTSNEKNKAQKQIDFFGKFVFLSNDEGKALPIEKGETRFAVFKVPTFAEKGLKENPNIEAEFLNEIPHFLYFLKNRKLVHKEQSRMYFALEAYHTEQLQYYYDNSLSSTGKAIKEWLIESFNFFEEEKELRYSISNICTELEGRFKYLDRSKVKKSLLEEFNLPEQKKSRYKYYSLKSAERTLEGSIYVPNNENYFHFIFNRTML